MSNLTPPREDLPKAVSPAIDPTQETSKPTIPPAPASNGVAQAIPPEFNAANILQNFLNEKGIELRLTPPNVRPMQDGGLLLDPPQILVTFKQTPPVNPVPPTGAKQS